VYHLCGCYLLGASFELTGHYRVLSGRESVHEPLVLVGEPNDTYIHGYFKETPEQTSAHTNEARRRQQYRFLSVAKNVGAPVVCRRRTTRMRAAAGVAGELVYEDESSSRICWRVGLLASFEEFGGGASRRNSS
jgi:hypothetical protein